MTTLTIAGLVCGLLAMVALPWLFAPLAMVLGVAALVKGRWENGLAVIVIAALCGVYGISKSLNFINDFFSGPHLVSIVQADPTATARPIDANWRIMSLQAAMISDDAEPTYQWKMVIKNESVKPTLFHGTLEFQDDHGVKLSEVPVEGPQVCAGCLGVFGGSVEVKGRSRIARAVPQITVGGGEAPPRERPNTIFDPPPS